MKKKLNTEELNNVSGGHYEIKRSAVTCPKCNAKMSEDDALLRKESNCGNTVKYFKCTECKHEWSKED